MQAEEVESDEITAEEMVEWFCQHYDPAHEAVPHDSESEDGHCFINGGPEDLEEVISDEFPEAAAAEVEEAVRRLEQVHTLWVRKDDY